MKYIWVAFFYLFLTSCTIEMHEQNYKRILRNSVDLPENVWFFEYFDNSFIKFDFPYLKDYYGSPYTYSGSIRNYKNDEIDKMIIRSIIIKFDDGERDFKIIDLLSNDFPLNDISITEESSDRIRTDITGDLRTNNNITINNNENNNSMNYLKIYPNNKKILWLKNKIDNGNPIILLVKVKIYSIILQ